MSLPSQKPWNSSVRQTVISFLQSNHESYQSEKTWMCSDREIVKAFPNRNCENIPSEKIWKYSFKETMKTFHPHNPCLATSHRPGSHRIITNREGSSHSISEQSHQQQDNHQSRGPINDPGFRNVTFRIHTCIHNMSYRAGWRSGNSLSLYLDYPRFETRLTHLLPWYRFFLVFLILSRQILG